MSTCISCNTYYRLDPYHHDQYNCQDCTAVLPDEEYDEDDTNEYISALTNPSGKVLPVYNEKDLNDTP